MQGGGGRGPQKRSPNIENNVAGAQASAGWGARRGEQRKKSGVRVEKGNGSVRATVNRAPSGDAKSPPFH